MGKGKQEQIHKQTVGIRVNKEMEDVEVSRKLVLEDPFLSEEENGKVKEEKKAAEDSESYEKKEWVKSGVNAVKRLRQKKEHELEKEKERIAKEKYDKAHTVKNHSTAFRDMIRKEKLKLGYDSKSFKLDHIPGNTVLTDEYRGEFAERIMDKTRVANKTKESSRLYRKKQNADQLRDVVDRFGESKKQDMELAMKSTTVRADLEDYQDVMQFMQHGNEQENELLVQSYFGKSKAKGHGGKEGQDVQLALDLMVKQLFAIDMDSLHLENDTEMVKCSAKLEQLSRQIAAFDRLADKHNYAESLAMYERNSILIPRLEELRAIAAYYNLRKEIITNEKYMDSYNNELSMDMYSNYEQMELAEKLVKSFILGQNLMMTNGVAVDRQARLKKPKFKNPAMSALFDHYEEYYSKKNVQKSIVSQQYKAQLAKDSLSDEQRMNALLSKNIRKAFDIESTANGYKNRYYSVESTTDDNIAIDRMLKGIELGSFKVSDKELAKAKLNAIKGRNMAHILINDKKLNGDSPVMKRVKDAVMAIENKMAEKKNAPLTDEDINNITNLYNNAINECRNYCDTKDPGSTTGKRRKAKVQAILEQLMRESDAVFLATKVLKEQDNQQGEDRVTVNSGIELLSLAALKMHLEKAPVDNLYERETDYKHKKALLDEAKEELKPLLDKYSNILQIKKQEVGFFMANFNPDVVKALDALNAKKLELGYATLENDVRESEALLKQAQTEKDAYDEKVYEKETAIRRKRYDELNNANEKITLFNGELQLIAAFFMNGESPSSSVRNKNKLSNRDRKLIADISVLKRALSRLASGGMKAETVYIAGRFVRLDQDRVGNLNIIAGDAVLPCAFSSMRMNDIISEDIINNPKLYGDSDVNFVLRNLKTDLSEMKKSDVNHTREYTVQLLFGLTGIKKALFNNFTSEQLKNYALRAMEAKDDKKIFAEFKNELNREIERTNNEMKQSNVNTMLNLELQKAGVSEEIGVINNIAVREETKWKKKERLVRDFAADILFSKDSVMADTSKQISAGERMRQVLLNNLDAITYIINDQFRNKKKNPEGLIEGMFDQLPLFALGNEEVVKLKQELAKALTKITNFIENTIDSMVEEDGMPRSVLVGAVKGTGVKNLIKNKLEKISEEDLRTLADVDKDIDSYVKEAMNGIQSAFDSSVEEIFKDDNEEQNAPQNIEQNAPQNIEQNAPQNDVQNAPQNDVQNAPQIVVQNAPQNDVQNAPQNVVQNAPQNALNGEQMVRKALIEESKKKITDLSREAQTLRNQNREREAKEKEKELLREKKSLERMNRDDRMREIREKMSQREAELQAKKAEIKHKLDEAKRFVKNSDEYTQAMQEVKALKNAYKAIEARYGDKLQDIISDSVKGGKRGQSLFMKNVMKTYFKSVSAMDQRSMLAGALRNCNPIEKLTDEQIQNLSDEQKLTYMSEFVGGMFKGAGPLFQKMLQGLPVQSLPLGLRKAVEDTQDSLASIPEPIIQAHIQSIVDRSNGKITTIEILKSLGAASVGQAFLCKIYGPGFRSKNVVIKLLRPDVRNRMMREKDIMLKAARMTDEEGKLQIEIDMMREKGQIGGMEATYLGNLQRMEEELDLTIEAENCKNGQVYNKPVKDADTGRVKTNLCDSMKMSTLVEPTSDTLMLEMAGTKTVKQFMNDMRTERERLVWPYCKKIKEKDKNGKETGKEVLKINADGSYELRDDLTYYEKAELRKVTDKLLVLADEQDKKTKALAQLAEKWVTEGVFEKGFYHGDLHAGNIMISKIGVTVIDFGNATVLNTKQQGHVTRMMTAAAQGDVENFRHNFHQLLENTPEEVYQEKREELTLVFKDILTTGSKDNAAERIAVALIKAQEMGLELPPVIANFSSCQMRLQNTLTDMNNSLKCTRKICKQMLKLENPDDNLYVEDCVAKTQKDMKSSDKKTKRANILKFLDRKEFISKDDFKKLLRKNDQMTRDEFKEFFSIKGIIDSAKLLEEFNKMDGWLSGRQDKKPSAEDIKKHDTDGMRSIFPNYYNLIKYMPVKYANAYFSILESLERIVFDEDGRAELLQENLLNKPGGRIKSMAKLIDVASNLEERDKRDFDFLPAVTAVDRKYSAYIKAVDEKQKSQQEIEALEDELYEEYKLEREDECMARCENEKKIFGRRIRNILPIWERILHTRGNKVDDEGIAEFNSSREKGKERLSFIIASCAQNKTNGTELSRVGEEFVSYIDEALKTPDDYVRNKEEFEEKLRHLTDILWKAQIYTLHELYESAEDGKALNDKKPQTFLDIMSDVMNLYSGKVFKRLNTFISIKLSVLNLFSSDTEEENNQDEEQ